MKKLALLISLVAFVVTLSLNIVSVFYSPFEKYQSEHTTSVDVVPGYHNRIRSLSEISEALENSDMEFDVHRITNLVFESLIHSDNRRIDIRENWLLWGLGLIYEPILRTQDPHRIVSGGAAICSEAAAVLNHVSEINGYPARFIGLSGHVVSEVRVDDKWYLADADYGIAFPMGYLELIEMDATESHKILQSLLQERGFGREVVDFYSDVLFSANNNIVQSAGEKQSPRLWYIERISEPLKWILTIIFGLISLVMFRKVSREVA